MKKIMSLVPVLFIALPVFATEVTCYQVSTNGSSWSQTPELLCVSEMDSLTSKYDITLKTGLLFNQQTIATFSLNLTSSVSSTDSNKNVYSLSNPTNSIFNALAIRFDGKRNIEDDKEIGTVEIGSTKFHYRSIE